MEKQNSKAAIALEDKREKFVNSAWKLISYVFFVAIGLWAIQTEHHWFWDPYTYHLPYPEGKVPSRIITFYALETGYYIYSTFAVFFEPKMKDRAQMFVHHVFTTFLLVSSFVGNTTKFGVPIMLLHDVADPPMEFAKLCIYTGRDSVLDMHLHRSPLILFCSWQMCSLLSSPEFSYSSVTTSSHVTSSTQSSG